MWRATPIVLVAILLAGCSRPPQISAGNRKLVESLRTAVFSQHEQWLAENAKLVDERHREGKLSDAEYAALQAIVDQAKQGDWSAAKSALDRLANAQQPTQADLERTTPGAHTK